MSQHATAAVMPDPNSGEPTGERLETAARGRRRERRHPLSLHHVLIDHARLNIPQHDVVLVCSKPLRERPQLVRVELPGSRLLVLAMQQVTLDDGIERRLWITHRCPPSNFHCRLLPATASGPARRLHADLPARACKTSAATLACVRPHPRSDATETRKVQGTPPAGDYRPCPAPAGFPR